MTTPGAITARRLSRRTIDHRVLGALGFLCLLVLLEVLPRSGLVPARLLPPFSEVVVALAEQLAGPAFWVALGETVRAWFLGLLIAFVLGVVVGVAIGSTALMRELTASTVEFLRPIPSVALIPLAVLLFGTDLRSTLLLVVYASFWQVLVQVIAGIQDVDPVARDTAGAFRLGRWARLRHVLWPSAAPYVLTGLRLGATVALILAITGELVIGSPGLGKEIGTAQSGGAVATMYALVFVTGLLGVAVDVVTRVVERRLLAWHPSVRREVPR